MRHDGLPFAVQGDTMTNPFAPAQGSRENASLTVAP